MKRKTLKQILSATLALSMILCTPVGAVADTADAAALNVVDEVIEDYEASQEQSVFDLGVGTAEDSEAVENPEAENEKQVEEETQVGANAEGVTVGNPYKHASKKVTYSVYNGSSWEDQTKAATVWDCVWFGSYWQDSTDTSGSKQPIKWRVLSVKGDDALIMADMGLDAQPYNTSYTSITWKDCTLRSWLNNDFYNNAFSTQAKSAIISTTLVNDDNPYYGTEGGDNTTDNVFLLSIADSLNADYGFDSTDFNTGYYYNSYDPGRRVEPTAFAKARGASYNTSGEYANKGWWWLRSPGSSTSYAADVYGSGRVNLYGTLSTIIISACGPLCI